MLKIKCASVFCVALLLMTGCAAKDESDISGFSDYDDFDDYSVTEYPPVEYLSAETEFAEYDGNIEKIWVDLTNDRDEYFRFDYNWHLEKEVDSEWRAIRFIKKRVYTLEANYMPRGTVSIGCELKDNVKQPLLPGHYRIWVGGSDKRVPAEFTIK